jgi:Tfp pilus assembly protein PilN
MNNVVKVDFGRRKRPTSVVGLSLDTGRLEAVLLQRANGSVRIGKAVNAPLTAALATSTPEVLGAEIRALLDAAGIRERHCVAAIPARWLLTGRTEMPDLPEADAKDLLQLEAERSFSTDTAALRIDDSRCVLPGGSRHVTLVGVSTAQLGVLEKVLEAAKLKPVSLTVAVSELQPPDVADSADCLTLLVGDDHVGLMVSAGGGVAALRTIEGSLGEDGVRQPPPPEVVGREIRITLGQLPEALRQAVARVRIFGPPELAARYSAGLGDRFVAFGLRAETMATYTEGLPAAGIPSGTAVSVPLSLAARYLSGSRPAFEFLPPKPTLVGQLVARYSAGRLKTAGGLAAAVVVLLAGFVLYQQVQLMLLTSKWSQMSAKVADLESMQQRIRQYRPWFDDSLPNLAIVRQLSTAFPQDGSVTATSIEIRDGSTVTCSGTARDSATFLHMLDTLNAAPGIALLHRDQIRGTAPIQFTFGFQWNPGGAQ